LFEGYWIPGFSNVLPWFPFFAGDLDIRCLLLQTMIAFPISQADLQQLHIILHEVPKKIHECLPFENTGASNDLPVSQKEEMKRIWRMFIYPTML
jgi:hypothetical protein